MVADVGPAVAPECSGMSESPLERIQARLEEIKNREQAATEGPWIIWAGRGWERIEYPIVTSHVGCPEPEKCIAFAYSTQDQKFISHARTDVPQLMKALEQAIKDLFSLNSQSDVNETIWDDDFVFSEIADALEGK